MNIKQRLYFLNSIYCKFESFWLESTLKHPNSFWTTMRKDNRYNKYFIKKCFYKMFLWLLGLPKHEAICQGGAYLFFSNM